MANKNALHQIFQGKSLKYQGKFREFGFSKMWSPWNISSLLNTSVSVYGRFNSGGHLVLTIASYYYYYYYYYVINSCSTQP